MRYSLAEIQAMPVIEQSQFDNLHLDNGTFRVWLSRVIRNWVTAEKLVNGKWVTVDEYEAT